MISFSTPEINHYLIYALYLFLLQFCLLWYRTQNTKLKKFLYKFLPLADHLLRSTCFTYFFFGWNFIFMYVSFVINTNFNKVSFKLLNQLTNQQTFYYSFFSKLRKRMLRSNQRIIICWFVFFSSQVLHFFQVFMILAILANLNQLKTLHSHAYIVYVLDLLVLCCIRVTIY